MSVDDTPGVVPDRKIFDAYDGMILVYGGWDFKDVVPLDPAYDPPAQGEALYMFGNPAGLRDMYREGVLAGVTLLEGDDVAPGSLIFVGTMNIQGGDSGSSIYGADGRRVGVVTWGIFGGKYTGFYPLGFTAEQIREAE